MLTMNVISEWARQHPKTWHFRRVAGPRKIAVTRAGRGSGNGADVPRRDPRAVPARPELFGVPAGLFRVLVALMRQPYEGASDRARARAGADRLVETLRVLSAL